MDVTNIIFYPPIMILMFSSLFVYFWFFNKNHPCVLWLASSLFINGSLILWITINTENSENIKTISLIEVISYALMAQSILVRFRSIKSFASTLSLGVASWMTMLSISEIREINSFLYISIPTAITSYYVLIETRKHLSSHAFDKAIKYYLYVLSLFLITNGVTEKFNISYNYIINPISIISTMSSALSFLMVACCMQDSINSMQLLSITDPLTGALNKRSLMKLGDKINISKMGGVALFLCDIDHFKVINDNYGHDVGDDVIRRFSKIIKNTIRSQDMIFRYGGEEFVVILHPVSKEQSIDIIEKIRSKMRTESTEPKFTASFGLVLMNDNNLKSAIKEADRLMYQAKKQGRDSIKY